MLEVEEVVEQVSVVRLGDAQRLLHGRAGQADLVPLDHPPAGGELFGLAGPGFDREASTVTRWLEPLTRWISEDRASRRHLLPVAHQFPGNERERARLLLDVS